MQKDLDTRLLATVSRSFYLSLRFLPKGVRPGLSGLYLVARATDTVADTANTSGNHRVACLRKMARVILDDISDELDSLTTILRTELAPIQSHSGEKELLMRFDEVWRYVQALPIEQVLLIKRTMSHIIKGQILDLQRFDCPEDGADTVLLSNGVRALPNVAALENYTYLVAGCVGEFWTDLCLLVYGDRYAQKSEWLDQISREFGQALQYINILRDVEEDAVRGRCYFPVSSVADFPTLWASAWNRGWELCQKGFEYTRCIRLKSVRVTTALPALLGKETLLLLKQNPPQAILPSGKKIEKIKVSRGFVYKSLVRAFISSFFPRLLQ